MPERAPTKPILLPLLLTVPVLVLAWRLATQTPASPMPSASDSPTQRSIYRTSAIQLYRDYGTDAAAVQARIGQQPVLVTGTVLDVSRDFLGQGRVLLDVGTGNSAAGMALMADQNLLAVKLQRGQTVSILCSQMQRLTDAPEGSDCRLLDSPMSAQAMGPETARAAAASEPPAYFADSDSVTRLDYITPTARRRPEVAPEGMVSLNDAKGRAPQGSSVSSR